MIDLNTQYAWEMMRKRRLAGGVNIAKFSVRTTAENQILKIATLTVSAATDVDWGDTTSSNYTGTGERTHTYANAGAYEVKIMQPENVTVLSLHDSKVNVLNSADIKGMINLSSFSVYEVTFGIFDTSHLISWRPTSLYIFAKGSININSKDIKDWQPTHFQLDTVPQTTGTIDTADLAGWNPTQFSFGNLPNMSGIVSPSSVKNWTKATAISFGIGSLSQQSVNLLLWECYQINRTVTGGAITVKYTNAAPSGTFQACQSCPVTASTPGKEIAHELLNDGCGKGFNKWATVSTN